MKIVVLEDWNRFFQGAPAIEALRQRAEVEIQDDRPSSSDDLIRRLNGAGVVVLNRERTKLSADILAALPDLELIVQTSGIGPNVDSAAATAQGIALAAGPGLPNSIDGVAELAIGLLINLARQISANDWHLRAGRWDVAPTVMLSGGTMGVFGLGRLGKALARIGKAMNMRVIASGPTLTPERAAESGVDFVSLDDLCAQSDALFICPRLTDLTRGIVTRRHIDLMKPSAYLINVARGPIVDEDALVDALRDRRLAGAGLDVFGTEPLPLDHPLVGLDNVILTPHIGWVAATNVARFAESVADRITRYLDGDFSKVLNPDALTIRPR